MSLIIICCLLCLLAAGMLPAGDSPETLRTTLSAIVENWRSAT